MASNNSSSGSKKILVPEARAQAESPTDDEIRDLVARAHAGAVAHL